MNKKKLYKQSRQRNMNEERYHGPLITNEVSLGYIKVYPWIMLPITIFLYFAGGYNDTVGIIKALFFICVLINGFSIIFGFFNSLVNRFKSLTYILIGLVAWSVLISLTFIGLWMFTTDGSPLSARTVYDSDLSLIYVIPMLLIFLFICCFYTWYYLPKNQGKIWAFNRWETYVGKKKSKKQERLFNFGVAFVAVMLAPAILTGYIEKVFGISFGILITVAFPAVMVDAVYAAIYIRKHPDYDELN